MIFRSMLGKVLEGLSNLSPVKNLIKFVLDRTLNELLSDQISIQDFKNGELFLTKITLNVDKINKEYLLSSPYIMHSGKAQKLKIIMPKYSELSTKSVEVILDGLQLDLKPNKNFAENFKEAMNERQNDLVLSQQIESNETIESNPLDFFRQLIKQILLNMKVTLQNSVIKLFINEPFQGTVVKPQFYLMFRVPKLYIGKSEDIVLKNQGQIEQMKFDMLLPQFSVHLLREGTSFPEFSNEFNKESEFPFTYPGVNHPGTILLIGKSNSLDEKDSITKLTLGLTTNFKEQKKQVRVSGRIGYLQTTVDPIQLKVLSRFIAQINQFKKITKSVFAQFGLNSSQESINLSMSRKGGKSGSFDLFASVALLISQPKLMRVPSKKMQANLISKIMNDTQMIKSAQEFNTSVIAQCKKSGQELPDEGYRNITFKQELNINFELGRLQINLLKYVPGNFYQRSWTADGNREKVNSSLGCSHYRAVFAKFNYSFSSINNRHDIGMKYAKIHDVRLSNVQSFHASINEQFYDLSSNSFASIESHVEQSYFNQKPLLSEFQARPDQHYCMQQLFRVSEGRSPVCMTDSVKRYAFMPEVVQSGEGDGLRVSFNNDAKVMMIEIKEVVVIANFQIWKDVLNIVYPIFLYKQLAEKINMQSSLLINLSQPQSAGQSLRNAEIFESRYNFQGSLIEQVESKQKKLRVNLKVELIYCLYRQNEAIKAEQDLIGEVERKLLDSDNFSKDCFCNITERALYAQITKLQFDHSVGEFALSLSEIKAGLLNISNSEMSTKDNPEAFLNGERIRVEQYEDEDSKIKTRIFVPKIKFSVELPELITFIDMVKKSILIIESLLGFQRSLNSKIVSIEKEMLKITRVVKQRIRKTRVLEVFVGQVELKMLLLKAYIRSLYFKKVGRDQQLKFQALALGLAQELDTRLGQYRNQMLTSVYPKSEKYPGVYDTNLMLQIGRETVTRMRRQKETKAQIRLDFFNQLEVQQMSAGVFLKEKMEETTESAKSKKSFKFNKNNNKLKNIEEEKRCKAVNILLTKPLYVHVGNVTFLLRQTKELEEMFAKVGKVLEEIKSESKQIMSERKESFESEGESIEHKVSIKGGQIFVDIRPDFSYDAASHVRMLSNVRMVGIIQIHECVLTMNVETEQYCLNLNINAKGYFLHHLDREVELNPVFLNLSQLQLFGFRNIVNVDSIGIHGENYSRKNGGFIQCGIDNINISVCLSSLPLLNLFLQHFLRHNLAGDYGKCDFQSFELVEDVEVEEGNNQVCDEVEDLTQKLQDYQKIIEEKIKNIEEFKLRQYKIRPINETNNFHFQLKKFSLNHVKFDFLGGEQFKFIQCDSLYESKATNRSRSEHPDLINYIELTVCKIEAQLEVQLQTQISCSFEQLAVMYFFRRKQGILMWQTQKLNEFSLLKIEVPIRALISMREDYVKVKLNKLQLQAGGTDYIIAFLEHYQKAVVKTEKSGWKRMYQEKSLESDRRTILLMIPQGRITASIEYKRTMPIKDRVLELPSLTLHERESSSERMNQIFNDWQRSFINKNTGKLISGVLFQALNSCIGLIIRAIRALLGLFFPFFQN